jgi:hypothetical protein
MMEVREFKDSNTGAPAKHGHIGEKKRLDCRDLDDSSVSESMFEKDKNRVLDCRDRALRVAVLTCHLEHAFPQDQLCLAREWLEKLAIFCTDTHSHRQSISLQKDGVRRSKEGGAKPGLMVMACQIWGSGQ